MSKTTKIIIGVIVVLIVIGGIWYGIGTQKPKGQETIKIGTVLPLTGEMASYGEGWKNAILLAIEDSGLKNKVQLIVEDDASCVVNQDVTIAQKLVNIDNVKAIIGPACSSSLLSMLPITEKDKIILISSSATSKSISGAGNYIFRTISSDAEKATGVADFAYNKDYRKAALLYNLSNDAYVQQREEVKNEFIKLGGQIVADESLKTGDTDFKSQLTKIKNSGADLIFVGFFPTKEGVLVFKQAKELGIKTQFISSAPEMGTPDFINVAGNLAEGIIFPFSETPTNKEYSDFINLYKNKFGKEPAGYSAETYDAAILLLKSINESDGTQDGIKNKLYQLGQNYYGASGIITFKENGDVEKPIVIKIIKNGQFVPYEK